MKFTLLAALAALAFAFSPLPVRAAESFDDCKGYIDSLPATISTPGVWCLRKDLSTAMHFGSAIDVRSENVTIDCKQHKVGGLAAGPDTWADGITAFGFRRTTVRRCRVRGFVHGILLQGERSLVEGNRLDANVYGGIHVYGSHHTVRDNVIADTGGSPGGTYAIALMATDGFANDIADNDIVGVEPEGDSNGNRTSHGIYTTFGVVVRGNRISGLVSAGTGQSLGVVMEEGIATGNTLLQPAGTVGTGIMGDGDAMCHDNVIKGYGTATAGCAIGTNVQQP